jgi:hypothetical protein
LNLPPFVLRHMEGGDGHNFIRRLPNYFTKSKYRMKIFNILLKASLVQ